MRELKIVSESKHVASNSKSSAGVNQHSLEAEQCVLGGLLLDNSAYQVISRIIDEHDFYSHDHKIIYRAIQTQADKGEPFEIFTLAETIKAWGGLKESETLQYLAAIQLGTASAATVAVHAKTVRKYSLERKAKAAHASGDFVALAEICNQINSLKYGLVTTDIRDSLGIRSLDAIMNTDYQAPRWAIPDLLPEGLTLLAGPPKVKKSWFALAAAIAIGMGGKVLGRIDVKQGRVLYLALEDRERRLQSRAKLILSESNNGPKELDIVTNWKRLDKGGINDLRMYLESHPETRLIIVDTLAMVRPNKLRGQSDYDADYQAVGILKKLADEFSTSVLIITHTRKQESEDFLDAVTGTHGVSGAADGVLVLKRPRCSDKATLSITGRDIENEREIVLAWDNRTCTWHQTDDSPASVSLTPERQRIVDLLRSSPTPLSSKQIATTMHGRDMDKNDSGWASTRGLLGKLVLQGVIRQLDNKSYTISERVITPITPITPSVSGVSGCNFKALTPNDSASDCFIAGKSFGVTGVSGCNSNSKNSVSEHDGPPDFGTSDEGYLTSMPEWRN